MVNRGAVVSDLHLLSPISTAVAAQPIIESLAASADVLILNGDIFDFRRSVLASTAKTSEFATNWLKNLITSFPKCHFHYVLGNHDYAESHLGNLDALKNEFVNFSVHPHFFRLGPNLFIHGDMCHGLFSAETLDERRQRRNSIEPDWKSILFAKFVGYTGLNKIAYITHPTRLFVERIVSFMESSYPDLLKGITDVYIGHTHVAFENFEYQGRKFHNTGATIRGMKFMPQRFEFN